MAEVQVPDTLTHGEILLINGSFWKVAIDAQKDGHAITLKPTNGGKLSKAPWRIIQKAHEGKWVPAIIDENERLVALVFGRDEAQRDANAIAILQAHLYQGEASL
jgi:hypothetical protein